MYIVLVSECVCVYPSEGIWIYFYYILLYLFDRFLSDTLTDPQYHTYILYLLFYGMQMWCCCCFCLFCWFVYFISIVRFNRHATLTRPSQCGAIEIDYSTSMIYTHLSLAHHTYIQAHKCMPENQEKQIEDRAQNSRC